jgi:hypothetical protein
MVQFKWKCSEYEQVTYRTASIPWAAGIKTNIMCHKTWKHSAYSIVYWNDTMIQVYTLKPVMEISLKQKH